MYTVIRSYKNAKTLGDELMKRKNDVESLISTVPGFIAYYLIRTQEGVATVTVCENRAGCDESTKRAAEYVREKLGNLSISPPEVIGGELGFRFTNYKAAV